MELTEEELGLRYQVSIPLFKTYHNRFIQMLQSFCDPRLNFEQSLGKPFGTNSARYSADV